MSGVPTTILVGPTTYVHFRRKHKDYFVPDFLAALDPPAPDQSPHVWRYTVSPDHHNTVFFFNAVTKKSVWVLPIVHTDGKTEELGEGEVMQAIHDARGRGSGSSGAPSSPSSATRPSEVTARDATASVTDRSSAVKSREGSAVLEDGGGANGTIIVSNQNATEDAKRQSSESQSKSVEAAQSSRAPGTSHAADTAVSQPAVSPTRATTLDDSVSRERVQAALQRAQQANSPLTISIGGNTTTAAHVPHHHHSGVDNNSSFNANGLTNESITSANGSPSGSLQQRLAAWRAKRPQPLTENTTGNAHASGVLSVAAPSSDIAQPVTAVMPTEAAPVAAAAELPTQVVADPLAVSSLASPLTTAGGVTLPDATAGTAPASVQAAGANESLSIPVPPGSTKLEAAATAEAAPTTPSAAPPQQKVQVSAPATPAATTKAVETASPTTPPNKTPSPVSPASKSQHRSEKRHVDRKVSDADRQRSVEASLDAGRAGPPSPLTKQLDVAAQARLAQAAELARVAALLHAEKIRAMQQERAALECRRRARVVEQQEAAERTRLTEARLAAEKRRLEEEDAVRAEQQRQQQLLREKAMAESRVREVNQYVVKHAEMEAEAEATVADTFSYASRIAAQLAALAPRPEEVEAALRKQTGDTENKDALTKDVPTFRKHHVGGVEAPSLSPQAPFRTLPHNLSASAGPLKQSSIQSNSEAVKQGEARLPEQPARVRERLCYGVPFVYDGEVLDYKPAKTFAATSRTGAPMTSTRHASAPRVEGSTQNKYTNGLTLPDPPLLLVAKRDGTGTEYYDAAEQHFFTGEWREDKREGAGVLSLPNTAVQGQWKKNELSGAAVVQTKQAKANAAVTTAAHHHKSATSGTSTAAAAPSATAKTLTTGHHAAALLSQRNSADEAARAAHEAPSHHVALNGNAVVELSNKALFVGALANTRVAAPYVLQLGEGDYVEWLGPHAASTAKKKTRDSTQRTHDVSLFSAKKSTKLSESTAGTFGPHRENIAGSGECRIRFHNGDTFVGHVRDFQLHGMGYYRFARDGQSYTGAFQHGLPHGSGLMIFANGDLYKGEFVKGLFDGHGSYACSAGGYVYEGRWARGAMSGEGTLSYKNGDVWSGTFRDNARVSGAYTTVA